MDVTSRVKRLLPWPFATMFKMDLLRQHKNKLRGMSTDVSLLLSSSSTEGGNSTSGVNKQGSH